MPKFIEIAHELIHTLRYFENYDNKEENVIYGLDDSVLKYVSDKINYLNPAKENPRIKSLRDSIKKLDKEINELRNEREAYEKEKEMLMKNMSIAKMLLKVCVKRRSVIVHYIRSVRCSSY